jgi:prepilin-type processing-associated H-X9-DG protein
LLVVIGIIALLMGILLPALAKARATARETQCMSNIRQLGMGLQMYCDQNKGLLPADSNNGTKSNPVDYIQVAKGPKLYVVFGWNGPEMWFNAIPPMINLPTYYSLLTSEPAGGGAPVPGVGDSSVFICPSCTAVGTAANDGGSVSISNSYFVINGDNPSARTLTPAASPTLAPVTYATCMCYVPNDKILSATNPRPKIGQLTPAADVAIYVEKRMSPYEINNTDPWYTFLTTGTNAPYSELGTLYPSSSAIASTALAQMSASWTRFSSRHRNGGFVCFADGHVSWFSLDQLLSPPTIQSGTDDFNNPDTVIWNPFTNAP